MKLSFGMIFSIFLIIIFIVFAVYVIQKFVVLQDSVKTEQFSENLQNDVDKMWRGSQGSQQVSYSISNKIISVCFVDDEYENLIFNSEKMLGGEMIEHLDIEKTLGGKNSLCMQNTDGKIRMTLKKDYGEALVTIENEK